MVTVKMSEFAKPIWEIVVADALYDYGQTGFANKTDLAVTNGGGLRETIAKDKPITKGDVIAVLPFGNTISQIKVTGQNIADMFSNLWALFFRKKMASLCWMRTDNPC